LDSIIYFVGSLQFCGDMWGPTVLEAAAHLH
jgi:hypothetical protein